MDVAEAGRAWGFRSMGGAWWGDLAVAARVLACALAVPFLTVVLDAAAVLGGLAAELSAGGMTAQVYWQKSLLLLKLSVIVPATLKTGVFGLLIGLVGCWTGLTADRS